MKNHAMRWSWLVGLGALACSTAPTATGDAESEVLRTSVAALTPTQQSALSFEDPSLWQVVAGAATLAQSPLHTEGAYSLEVSNLDYVQLRHTVPLSQDGESPPEVVGYDLYLPEQYVNPAWMGDTQLFISAPSVGIWNQYLGVHSLQSRPVSRFHRFEYEIPDWIRRPCRATIMI